MSVTLFLEGFINIFKQADNSMQVRNNKYVTSNVEEQPSWWDQECQLANVHKQLLLKKFKAINSQPKNRTLRKLLGKYGYNIKSEND